MSADAAHDGCRDAGFIRWTDKLLSDSEREELIGYLAANPTAGDVMPGTRGARKRRWGLEGGGKRGGARIIHFFHSFFHSAEFRFSF